eukprot:CAMPEP_0174833194 /NCGR_PEP_ID=MMETSP1114-20130205/4084_1 /TAXON_ID=312471 /ORGANISM="Neobodo designis, Strain CCAP 1951/1" /LENGTH=582 /DNA_ID=CAMNT_0016067065 /DNA_START=556 /DNA_END=2304 /DNA_ORIENTATION=-
MSASSCTPTAPTSLAPTPKALLSPPAAPSTDPALGTVESLVDQKNENADGPAVEDLEKLCDRLIVGNLAIDLDDDDDGPLSADVTPTAGPHRGTSAGAAPTTGDRSHGTGSRSPVSSANATGAPTSEVPPPKGGFFDLVINPDPALLPTFNSTKSVEDILVDQARYGPFVRCASYDDVAQWFNTQRPPGLPLTAPPWGRHGDGAGMESTQVFIGQLPSFASEEWLTMCLEYVHGVPGSVHYTVVRRESTGTQAGYALSTLAGPHLVPVFIAMSRHVFFGKKHVFFTDVAQGHVNEFQRIIARVMAIDATRPNPEVGTVGYARACLVIATANPPASRNGPGHGRGRGGAHRLPGARGHGHHPHHHHPQHTNVVFGHAGPGMGVYQQPTPPYGAAVPLQPPSPSAAMGAPPPFGAATAQQQHRTSPEASGTSPTAGNVWGAPPLLSPKDIADAQRNGHQQRSGQPQAPRPRNHQQAQAHGGAPPPPPPYAPTDAAGGARRHSASYPAASTPSWGASTSSQPPPPPPFNRSNDGTPTAAAGGVQLFALSQTGEFVPFGVAAPATSGVSSTPMSVNAPAWTPPASA